MSKDDNKSKSGNLLGNAFGLVIIMFSFIF